jgi:hypothetical protein
MIGFEENICRGIGWFFCSIVHGDRACNGINIFVCPVQTLYCG